MLFAVVLPRTDRYESELSINSIVSKDKSDMVIFHGFIEGKSIEDCRNKVNRLNERFDAKYRLYGIPFSKDGNNIYLGEVL